MKEKLWAMLPWLLIVGGTVLIFVPGCTAISARGQTAKVMDSEAVLASSTISGLRNGTVDQGTAADRVRENAVTFRAWADKTTINVFAYLFGPKEILATPKWYRHIQRNAIRAEDDARRVTSRPALAPAFLLDESNRVLILKAVKDGVAPPD